MGFLTLNEVIKFRNYFKYMDSMCLPYRYVGNVKIRRVAKQFFLFTIASINIEDYQNCKNHNLALLYG
jgi:hypothetical protein